MADNRNILDDFKTNHDVKVIDTSVKLKVGIIGCGWIADAHIREYLKMPDVELVAFADLIPGKAEKFAKENGIIVVLKGASTIITDGEHVYINASGSSALAKAGSGDVLAGLIGAMCAQSSMTDLIAATASVYLHGAAGDSLAKEYSTYGVTPSDLPKRIAQQLQIIEENTEYDK